MKELDKNLYAGLKKLGFKRSYKNKRTAGYELPVSEISELLFLVAEAASGAEKLGFEVGFAVGRNLRQFASNWAHGATIAYQWRLHCDGRVQEGLVGGSGPIAPVYWQEQDAEQILAYVTQWLPEMLSRMQPEALLHKAQAHLAERETIRNLVDVALFAEACDQPALALAMMERVAEKDPKFMSDWQKNILERLRAGLPPPYRQSPEQHVATPAVAEVVSWPWYSDDYAVLIWQHPSANRATLKQALRWTSADEEDCRTGPGWVMLACELAYFEAKLARPAAWAKKLNTLSEGGAVWFSMGHGTSASLMLQVHRQGQQELLFACAEGQVYEQQGSSPCLEQLLAVFSAQDAAEADATSASTNNCAEINNEYTVLQNLLTQVVEG